MANLPQERIQPDIPSFTNVRRFVCRRGQVKHIRSDNGTNLVGACTELKMALSSLNGKKSKMLWFQMDLNGPSIFLVPHSMEESGKDSSDLSVMCMFPLSVNKPLMMRASKPSSVKLKLSTWSTWSGTTDTKPHSSAKNTTYLTHWNRLQIWPLSQTLMETSPIHGWSVLAPIDPKISSITPTEAEMVQCKKSFKCQRHFPGGWPHSPY